VQTHVVITDLAGNGLAHVADYTDLEAVDPLNDARTARLKVSLYDPAAALLKPLARGLKVLYGDALIFNGIQVSTRRSSSSRGITATATRSSTGAIPSTGSGCGC
jgi:hypothetical protein